MIKKEEEDRALKIRSKIKLENKVKFLQVLKNTLGTNFLQTETD